MLPDNTPIKEYTGNGVTKAFSFPYKFFSADHVTVYRKIISTGAISTVPNTEYVVTGEGDDAGGTFTFTDAPTSDHFITLLLDAVPLNQEADYVALEGFPADAHEAQQDKIIMILQQQREELKRCPKVDPGSGTTGEEYLTTIQQAVTDAQAAQTAAETAETNAETAETGAETAQGLAETARDAAIAARVAAEVAQTAAETAETHAETAQGLAESARDLSQNYAAALLGTSVTSVLIGTGSKTFTTQSGKQFQAGQLVLIASRANVANYMFGQVTSYTGTSLVVNVTAISGSGTFTDWNISIGGGQGPKGDTGNTGATGANGTNGTNGSNGLPINWRGAYAAETTYAPLDAVSYNGSSYVCILASTGNLPTNATYWNLMALKGSDGAGSGDVLGPSTNTDSKVPQWDGANAKTLKDGLTVGTGANNLVQLDASAKLPAVDGSQLTGISTTNDKVKNASADASAGYLIEKLAALYPVLYQRDIKWALKTAWSTAANRYTVQTPNRMSVDINGTVYFLTAQADIDLSNSANWDSIATDYRVAATRAGKNFYIYACVPGSGATPVILLSANSTTPTGYSSTTSRKIGGFHCLCVAVGTISGHTLTGFVAGDVLPASIWDLNHKPKNASPEGMVYSISIDKWVDIYLASGTGSSTTSVNGATISDTRNWMDFVDDGMAVSKRMLEDGEFQSIAAGCNEGTNITGSADPGTTTGHTDTAGRRMISNIGCEDCAGVMYQWLKDQSYQYNTSTWAWANQTGGKGQLYIQGNGDVKLLAGGYWGAAALCGSRGRNAYCYRWYADAGFGCRFCAEPI